MDIRPPQRPSPPPEDHTSLPAPVQPQLETPGEVPMPSPHQDGSRKQRMWIAGGIGLLLLVMLLLVGWYVWALSPIQPDSTKQVRVVVAQGETSADIGNTLDSQGIIRSGLAFRIYTDVTGTKDILQAGGYVLSPADSVKEIVSHMTTGKTDEFNVTIVPGLTLKQQQDPEVTNSLAAQGFSADELKAAFTRTYDHPLFADAPAGTTLEGFIYPETYRVAANTSAEALIELALDEFYAQIEESGLRAQLAAQNLTLYQSITLASIIQKEVSKENDQKQVAQVFLKRLRESIPLQSDPTFIYPARQAGEEPTVGYDSPYNTYKNQGLPPGPIANFNLSALLAVGAPASGDFLYFVADSEGVTHFSRTLQEHEANVARYCGPHCNDF